jgi:phosphoglucosamine mutase
VGTLMSNLGLEHALRALGIEFLRSAVGDRYVLEMLREHGGVLGGESSGHIICLDRSTTGDGMVSALQVLATMVQNRASLYELKQGMKKYPQHMINVPVPRRIDLDASATIRSAVSRAEAALDGKGRILLRASGTEPLIRVMVEGEDDTLVREQAQVLAAVVAAAVETRAETG